ncbi:hypothetical protein TKK_0014813 [Trichogramma kaykai]|uniref:Protein SMG9 n=1 Tax=Trichogramma kaykai TaxID=54128 RepID=A0ABD2WD05_9HYME
MASKKVIPIDTKDLDFEENEIRAIVKVMDRPTIILKTRESESRAVSPSLKNENKKDDTASCILTKPSSTFSSLLSWGPEMTYCIKFMNEHMQLCETVLDFLTDQQDFLVVGCVGLQGVGKSFVLTQLASSYKPNVFQTQQMSHHENGSNCTSGIDFFVTRNRVIYLDTQPFLSGLVTDYSTYFEQKKNSGDYVINETTLEVQSLQFLAFMFSVCHVVILVQDWFVDPNLIRFLQAAEMLKPSSSTSMDQNYVEHYPHLVFLQNKGEAQDFEYDTIDMMSDFYEKTFASSRLQIHSGLNMKDELIKNELNLFILPLEKDLDECPFYKDMEEQIDFLRRKLFGVTKRAMTPVPLTEKNWFHYANKVLESIKKSHLASEYGRLLP